MQKYIDLIIEDNCILLAQSLGNKKLQANCKLKCNESTHLADEKTDNFKNDEITLLHVAAFYDALECFCFLESKYKTKTNDILRTPSTKSYYPLHYACFNGSREIVAYILSKDPEEASMILPNIDHHFLFYAVYGGDPLILTALFKNGADLDEHHNKSDDPIGKAISLSQIECLKVLLKYEKRSSNSSKYTPAMLASKNCHPEALKLLINSEEDITTFNNSNESVISLMFYYANGLIFKDVLISLLRKYSDARIEPPYEVKTTGVVHWICKMANKEVAQLMIETKDVNVNRFDENFYSGPHYMAIQKNIKEDTIIDILKILLDHNFDVNLKPENVLNAPRPIEYFLNAMVRRIKVIRFLLDRGANLKLSSSKDPNKTIYQQAMNTQNQEIKNLLSSYQK